MKDNGTYLEYVPKRFNRESLETIDQANDIIAEYEAQGLDMTLRQLYYQMVSRGIIPNRDTAYNRLKGLISDGRLAGIVSWTAIVDRTRNLMGVTTYDNPKQVINNAAESYKRDLWVDQPFRPEVWVEKEALVGVIQGICVQLRVDFFAVRGYNSQSEQWRAGQRFADYVRRGQRPIVFHLGDHDPSGVDMTRDNRERLEMFAGVPINVQRLALNMDQVEELNPPPNPAKRLDRRIDEYRRYMMDIGHGDKDDTSWELDALPPTYIRDLITNAVRRVRNEELWDAALAREANEIQMLKDFAETMG